MSDSKNPNMVHVVVYQDSPGYWDAAGSAYLDEEKCIADIKELDIEHILQNVSKDIYMPALIPHVSRDSSDDMISYELDKLSHKVISKFLDNAEYSMIGGIHTYETLVLIE